VFTLANNGGSVSTGGGNGSIVITYTVVADITAVPTLSQWSLLLTGGLLAALALRRLKRRGG
jgi:hypothetical protein